jgi:hypothetical protein
MTTALTDRSLRTRQSHCWFRRRQHPPHRFAGAAGRLDLFFTSRPPEPSGSGMAPKLGRFDHTVHRGGDCECCGRSCGFER